MMMILSMPGIQGSKIVWYPQADESKNYNAYHFDSIWPQQDEILPNQLLFSWLDKADSPEEKTLAKLKTCKYDK